MSTMNSQFSRLIIAKKIVILLISQAENKNEKQGNFFVLFCLVTISLSNSYLSFIADIPMDCMFSLLDAYFTWRD